MYTSSPGSHNQSNCQLFQVPRTIPNRYTSCAPQQGPLSSERNPDDCGKKTFFNTSNFHRFHVQLFKLFLPQSNDQADSNSIINTLSIHLLKQNLSLNPFHEDMNTDAEKI